MSSTYFAQRANYLENALKFIKIGDSEKASEFLWGSMAEAIKMVARSKDIQLKNHKELGDESIRHTFLHAQSLHSNFYETGLLMEDVAMCAEEVRTTVNKLVKLVNGKR